MNDDDERDQKRVTKGEFVCAMLMLAQRDRDAYRKLRALGWESAIPRESDNPN